MVIQRWQSVYLLLGVIAMILVCIRPFGVVTNAEGIIVSELTSITYPVLLTLNILTGVLLLIDIFLYKNIKFQRMIAAVCILLMIGSIASTAVILTTVDDMWQVTWFGTPIGMACALICTLLARHRMAQDEKLLKSYDRLR